MADTGSVLSPGAALVQKRWDKTTAAEKLAIGRALTAARLKKRRGMVRAKSAKKSKRK